MLKKIMRDFLNVLFLSIKILYSPKRTFQHIFDTRSYGHITFLIFYVLASNTIGYIHSPERFIEDHIGVAHSTNAFVSILQAAIIAIGEVLFYSVTLFLLVLATRRKIGYHQILKTLSFSLAPLLYFGAVWGFFAGENLRYWEKGSSPWSIWNIPYTITHAVFIYILILGLFSVYRKSYPDFGKRFYRTIFGD